MPAVGSLQRAAPVSYSVFRIRLVPGGGGRGAGGGGRGGVMVAGGHARHPLPEVPVNTHVWGRNLLSSRSPVSHIHTH